MRPQSRAWIDGLAAFARDWRESRAATVPAADPAADDAEAAILTTHLAAWCSAIERQALDRRRFATERDPAAWDPDAAVVLTTSTVGIGVAERLLGAARPPVMVVPVTELEYRMWCIRRPDEAHRCHVNHWSWIKTRVPPQRQTEFIRHPLGPGETYWLHRIGTAGTGAGDGRACHLWKWDGLEATLLAPFIVEGALAHPAATWPRAGG